MKLNNMMAVCAASVAMASFAETQVFRLELDTDTDNINLVGVDGVRRPCCLLTPEEYALLTGDLITTWQKLNSTESGRAALHGGQVSHAISNGVDTVIYKDGYKYTRELPKRSASAIDAFAGRRPRTVAATPRLVINGTDKYRAWRESFAASKTNETREVTVVHDAASGKTVEVK